MKKCIILDIDGVLADHKHRVHHEHAQDWDKYHATMHLDPVIAPIAALARIMAAQGIHIFLCTGRSAEGFAVTLAWLKQCMIPCKALMMRKPGDPLSSAEIKRHMLKDIQGMGYEVMFVIEDKTSVVNMWREEKVLCLQMEDLTAAPAHTVPPKPVSKPDPGYTALTAALQAIGETLGLKGQFGTDYDTDHIQCAALLNQASGQMDPSPRSTAQILEDALTTFKERNKVYGDNYKMMGPTMASLFPNGITLKAPEDFIWFHLFELMIVKITRFACGVEKGNLHIDSLHDAGIYSLMTQSAAEFINAKEVVK